MIVFKYVKSYFNYSTNGRASINEYIRLSVIDLVLFVFLMFAAISISECLGQWPVVIIFSSLVWHHHAVTVRRRHDFYNQRQISYFERGANLIEAFIDFLSLFTLDSDEGENKYGPEPWDSKD